MIVHDNPTIERGGMLDQQAARALQCQLPELPDRRAQHHPGELSRCSCGRQGCAGFNRLALLQSTWLLATTRMGVALLPDHTAQPAGSPATTRQTQSCSSLGDLRLHLRV